MVTEWDVKVAQQNWRNWQEVFEHAGSADRNPLLIDATKFNKFLKEYSVQRTIRAGRSEELRQRLCSHEFPLKALLSDKTGHVLDEMEAKLRPQFGTFLGSRSLRSALSKIAAFLAPHAFVAWDKYARRGVNLALQRRRLYPFSSYADYLADINQLLHTALGEQLREACNGNYPTDYSSELDRFHKRVLDVYLMRIGGRDFGSSRAARVVSARS